MTPAYEGRTSRCGSNAKAHDPRVEPNGHPRLAAEFAPPMSMHHPGVPLRARAAPRGWPLTGRAQPGKGKMQAATKRAGENDMDKERPPQEWIGEEVFIYFVGNLELARIGSQFFVFALAPCDQTAAPPLFDTFATRLSAQPLRPRRRARRPQIRTEKLRTGRGGSRKVDYNRGRG